jgi:methylmalonyl-CoA/ethylmalonyl-CoA epimerase
MTTIDHLGIAVKSIDSAKALYEKLGLRVVREETIEHEKVKVALIPVGDSRVELLEATSPDSPVGKFIAKRGEGIHHIAMHVPNLSETVEELKKSGTRFVSEEIKVGAGGHLYVFVHPSSAGGVLLELCQDPVSPA